ncbi:adenosylcobinamide amidohydrolase [Puniceicoccaceae bacterium K14]|nr:adenosylcobinamide amidohydrolase [Puniceicoccaceae bacterium K14]
MIIGKYYEGIELVRKEKIAYARFLKPHRVLSTCRSNGGLREDLEYLYNHQSCEPTAHSGTDLCQVAVKEPDRYQKRICDKANIDPTKAASLGTAANMNNAAIAQESFQDLEVIAVVTAGVGTNAGRAGDPASYYISEEGTVMLEKKAPLHGTINILLFLSQELTAGATLSAASVAIEAKAAVLQELGAPSRYSSSLATGTGTDQIGIASLLGTNIVHTDANKHSKTGELVGLAVSSALRSALNLQCGMTPDSRRSSLVSLSRFGETQDSFIGGIQQHLNSDHSTLLKNNFLSVNHDPLTVAAVQACVHLRDQLAWKVLPMSCCQEILSSQAAQIACCVSNKPALWPKFREALSSETLTISNQDFLSLFHKAFALGFSEKWSGRFED